MRLAHLTWPEVDALDREIPVVVPVAGLVQGGRHLAVGTWVAALEAAVDRLVELSPDALFLPVLTMGVLEGHLAFPGTISHSFEALEGAIRGMVESLHHHGFRRFLFLVANKETYGPVVLAMRRMKTDHPTLRLFAVSRDSDFGHAGKRITSLAMHLDPSLVREDLRQEDGLLDFAWAFHTMDEVSETGTHGEPQKATEEMGVKTWSAWTEGVVGTIEDLASDQPMTAPPSGDHPARRMRRMGDETTEAS